MKTIIHVNQAHIRKNIRAEEENREPVLTVKTYKDNRYANTAIIHGIIYSPDKPLSCGARVWIETEGKVDVE